jgi:hypothetical protein
MLRTCTPSSVGAGLFQNLDEGPVAVRFAFLASAGVALTGGFHNLVASRLERGAVSGFLFLPDELGCGELIVLFIGDDVVVLEGGERLAGSYLVGEGFGDCWAG